MRPQALRPRSAVVETWVRNRRGDIRGRVVVHTQSCDGAGTSTRPADRGDPGTQRLAGKFGGRLQRKEEGKWGSTETACR